MVVIWREERRRTAAVRGVLEESRRSLLVEFRREERERTAGTERGVLGRRKEEGGVSRRLGRFRERRERGWGRVSCVRYNKLLIIATTASQRKRSLRGGVSSWLRFGERREGGQQLSEESWRSLGGISWWSFGERREQQQSEEY